MSILWRIRDELRVKVCNFLPKLFIHLHGFANMLADDFKLSNRHVNLLLNEYDLSRALRSAKQRCFVRIKAGIPINQGRRFFRRECLTQCSPMMQWLHGCI